MNTKTEKMSNFEVAIAHLKWSIFILEHDGLKAHPSDIEIVKDFIRGFDPSTHRCWYRQAVLPCECTPAKGA
jgi:hypothetical protein